MIKWIKLWFQKFINICKGHKKITQKQDQQLNSIHSEFFENIHNTIDNSLQPQLGLSTLKEQQISDIVKRFEKDVESNPVIITIDGKTYNSTNQEEIAEILKYLGEQLRAKK